MCAAQVVSSLLAAWHYNDILVITNMYWSYKLQLCAIQIAVYNDREQ